MEYRLIAGDGRRRLRRPSPAINLYSIVEMLTTLGICTLAANFFYQKFEIFAILSYLSPHLYTHNVEILLKRTDVGIHQ